MKPPARAALGAIGEHAVVWTLVTGVWRIGMVYDISFP